MTNLTIAQVKELLPDVAVSVAGQPREYCLIAGRKNQFCGVRYGNAWFEFSWESVTAAINFDRALII